VSKYCYQGKMFTGSEFEDHAAVVFDNETGLIEAAGPANEVDKPKGATDLSVPGSTILPGLVDAHLHLFGARKFDAMEFLSTPTTTSALRSVKDLRNMLDAGFTAIRDLGSKAGTFLRKAVEEGTIPGPTIITSGKSLAQTGGDDDLTRLPLNVSKQLSYSLYCDGIDGCRKAVRLVARSGANVIKVYASGSLDQAMEEETKITRQFSVEELKVIVEEAHAMNLKVASHAYFPEAMTNALDAGADSIEHGVGLTDEVASRIAKQGVFYVPTASVYEPFLPRLKPEQREMLLRHVKDEILLAAKHGVKIAMGTDFAGTDQFPHGQNYREIVLLSKVLGNKASLEATTKTGSACLGLKNSGEIKSGMQANLVIVNGEPSRNIESLNPEKVQTVIQAGTIRKSRN